MESVKSDRTYIIFIYFSIGRYESFLNPLENSTTDIFKLANAFNIGCFAYGSWNTLNNLVGEMKNPNK